MNDKTNSDLQDDELNGFDAYEDEQALADAVIEGLVGAAERIAVRDLVGEVRRQQVHVDRADAAQAAAIVEQVALVAELDDVVARERVRAVADVRARVELRVRHRQAGDRRRQLAIVEARGLKQVTDTGAIEKVVDEIVGKNPDKVADAKTNPKAIGWFVGQVMKASGGKANPQAVNELLKKKLGL